MSWLIGLIGMLYQGLLTLGPMGPWEGDGDAGETFVEWSW